MNRSLILLITWLAVFTAKAWAGDVIGFIYVGPKDDYGYNQAHALGAASVAKLPVVYGHPCYSGVRRRLVRRSSP